MFKPLHDRVLVRRVEQDEKTKGGIIIPDTAKEKPQQGEVVAVGSGARGDDKAFARSADWRIEADRLLAHAHKDSNAV